MRFFFFMFFSPRHTCTVPTCRLLRFFFFFCISHKTLQLPICRAIFFIAVNSVVVMFLCARTRTVRYENTNFDTRRNNPAKCRRSERLVRYSYFFYLLSVIQSVCSELSSGGRENRTFSRFIQNEYKFSKTIRERFTEAYC